MFFSQERQSTRQVFPCLVEAMALLPEGHQCNDGNPIFSFTFIFSLEFGLFHFYKQTLFSLLRHHPSAVSCDDSDLLLEESCVMDISTEVKIIWIIMIWGGITEVLCFIWVLVKLGFPFLGGRKQRIS